MIFLRRHPSGSRSVLSAGCRKLTRKPGPGFRARTAPAAPTQAAARPAAAARAARLPSTTGTVRTPFSLSPSTSFRSIRISRCRMPQNSAAQGPATAASDPGPCKAQNVGIPCEAHRECFQESPRSVAVHVLITLNLLVVLPYACTRCRERAAQSCAAAWTQVQCAHTQHAW